MTPAVSIIIPVYNTEKYLREALDTVLAQTMTDIEVLCVDDGSTDSSLEILHEYAAKDPRVTVYTQDRRISSEESVEPSSTHSTSISVIV